MQTSEIKLQDTPETVEKLARAIRQRFRVVHESADVPMHGNLKHMVRRWITVIVIDDDGEVTPTPE